MGIWPGHEVTPLLFTRSAMGLLMTTESGPRFNISSVIIIQSLPSLFIMYIYKYKHMHVYIYENMLCSYVKYIYI